MNQHWVVLEEIRQVIEKLFVVRRQGRFVVCDNLLSFFVESRRRYLPALIFKEDVEAQDQISQRAILFQHVRQLKPASFRRNRVT